MTRRSILRWGGIALAVLAAVLVAIPVAELWYGTRRAKACLESVEAARGPELPDCRQEIHWLVLPSRVPVTSPIARYRAEEINARMAIYRYVDAAVGSPSKQGLALGAEGISAQEEIFKKGSQRIVLTDLGRAEGGPDLGRSAALLGDRAALIARFDRFPNWYVWMRSMEAALIDGDPPRAFVMAKRYAEFDPRDEELRVVVAAMLCLGGDAKRGVELFTTVQDERARDKHEGWARTWGDVRTAIVACATRNGLATPKRPDQVEAGPIDLDEVRAAQRLRLVGKSERKDSKLRRDAAWATVQMLREGPRPRGARVRLLAALLAAGHPIDATTAADIAKPRESDGEPSILPPIASFAVIDDWMDTTRGLRPVIAAGTLAKSASKLRELAKDPELGEAQIEAITRAASVMSLLAARAYAMEGRSGDALTAIDEAGAPALPDNASRALAKALALHVAGEHAQALEAIEPAVTSTLLVVRAAALLERALLLASIPSKRAEARAAAEAADKAAEVSGDRRLDLTAQWVRLAFAKTRREGRPAVTEPRKAYGWVGAFGTRASWLVPEAEGTIDAATTYWERALRAGPEERRAIRYQLFRQHRGDSPALAAPYWALASALLGEGEGDREVWLDAFTLMESRRMPMRAYTWSRAEAARMRGDDEAAKLWVKRHKALVALAGVDEESEEICAFSGI